MFSHLRGFLPFHECSAHKCRHGTMIFTVFSQLRSSKAKTENAKGHCAGEGC